MDKGPCLGPWGRAWGGRGEGSRPPTNKGPAAVQGAGGSQRRNPWAASEEGKVQPNSWEHEKATGLVPVPLDCQVPLSKVSETAICLLLFSFHKGRILHLNDKNDTRGLQEKNTQTSKEESELLARPSPRVPGKSLVCTSPGAFVHLEKDTVLNISLLLFTC